METFEISPELHEAAKAEPEAGIGYQIVSIAFRSQVRESGVLFGRAYFVPDEVGGQLRRSASATPPPIDYFYLDEPQITPYRPLQTAWFTPHLEVRGVSSFLSNSIIKMASSATNLPPFFQYATGTEVFYRVSPYKEDKNILADGAVLPKCYCTSDNDMKVVPSGLAAVGRYALPSRMPAVHVFRIQPPKGTPFFCGTVTPNFGLAGGGVEAYFPIGCPKGSGKYHMKLPMK